MQVSTSSSGTSRGLEEAPISKTQRYKKITKPLLERKRRARINKCLDELKDIMTVALQTEGENVSKLEKADILELTVRHLHKLNQVQGLVARNPLEDLQKFQSGFTSCAQEAATFLLSTPGVDLRVGHRLFSHLLQPSPSSTPGFSRFPQPPAIPILQSSPPSSQSLQDVKHPLPNLTRPTPELKPPYLDVKPELVQLKQEEKTVPVKPEAVRLFINSRFSEPVWKPYT